MSFPISYFALKIGLSIKGYNGLIRLGSNFQSSFHIFESRCVIDFLMVAWNGLKFVAWGNWECCFPCIQLDF
jgi:hypothetical protein